MAFENGRTGPTSRRFGLASLVIVALVGLGAGLLMASFFPTRSMSSPVELVGAQKVSVAASPSSLSPQLFVELTRRVKPGVVNISTKKVVKGGGRVFRQFSPPSRERDLFRDFFGEEFFDRFFGETPQRDLVQRSLGSGFIIDKDGHIITNNHVIEGASEIRVRLSTEKEFDAEIIGRDSKTDLALIKIKSWNDLPVVELGDSDKVEIGEWVMAIGNPFGLSHTVTVGIVSAKGRVIGSGPYDNFIQTDASINPGNSGGPLINLKGEVVGINTAIVAEGQGIGFAIPVNMAKEIASQLQDKGHVTRGWLGVNIQEVTPELAKSFGLKESKGALVSQVVPNSPAEKAGIEQGDIILEFDGKEVSDSKELPRIVASTPVGQSVMVKISRNGKMTDRQVKLGEMEEKAEVAKAPSTHKRLGIMVQNLTPEIAQGLGLKKEMGVVVTQVEPGSPASDAGIQTGDVIREVDRKPVKDVEDFVQKVEKAKDQDTVLLFVQRGQNNLFAAVTPK